MKSFIYVAVFAICAVLIPDTSHAYVDPGSGSLMAQLVLAGFAGFSVFLKMMFIRLKSIISSSKKNY